MKTTTPKHESDPAFPYSTASFEASGLSKRELFAGMAMMGILSGDIDATSTEAEVAEISCDHADALLKELSK